MTNSDTQPRPTQPLVPWWLVAAVVAASATLLLWDQHRSHLLGGLSWLLLLGCPLLHLFMHRRHSGRHGSHQE